MQFRRGSRRLLLLLLFAAALLRRCAGQMLSTLLRLRALQRWYKRCGGAAVCVA